MSPHYTLGEPAGSAQANDSSGNGHPPLTMAGTGTAVAFGAECDLVGAEGLTAAAFTNGGRWLYGPQDTETTAPAATSLECWFRTTTATASLVSTGTAYIGLTIGAIEFSVLGMAGTAVVPGAVNDGEWHHVLVSATPSSVALYVDGAAVVSGGASTTLGALRDLAVGGLSRHFQPVPTGIVPTGTIAHVAARYALVTAEAAADRYEAGMTGFAGETVAARLTRLAGYAGMSPSELSFETGRVRDLAPLDTTGMTALTAMRAVEETEGGVLFDALDGTLTFHDRAHRYGATSAFTLSYTDGHIANAIRPVLDDQLQVNDMTCTNADGVTARVTDEASIEAHGLYRQNLDLATTDPDEPLLRASWVVNQYAEPLVRVSEVEVNVTQLSNALAAAVLSAQVGTMFTITNLPANAPSSTMRLFIEGRTDRITQTEDRIIFRTSPAEIYDVFTLDDPDKGLDSGYPLAY